MSALYEDMENLDKKKKILSSENLPPIYRHLHSYLFSQVLCILFLHGCAEQKLQFSSDICPALRAACSHHDGPDRPEKLL